MSASPVTERQAGLAMKETYAKEQQEIPSRKDKERSPVTVRHSNGTLTMLYAIETEEVSSF